jgi:hypothetical protein
MSFAVQKGIGISRQRSIWLRCFLGGCFQKGLALAALAAMTAGAQTVCANSADHRPCTDSEAKEMQTKICRDEPTPANLFVSHPIRLAGAFFDPTGAPINFDSIKPGHRTIAQIRDVATGAVLYAVPVHANGEFAFDSIPEGSYRLIIVWMSDGRFERLPLADQPKEMRCVDLKECRISSTITFHGTDNPIDFCPPK